jgi:serine/threonine protein kinase
VIGEGSQAVVRKVKHLPTGKVYALKSIDLSGQDTFSEAGAGVMGKRTLQQELSRLAAATHPNIVSYNEAFYVHGRLKLLMEYMDFGSLSKVVRACGPLPLRVLVAVTEQV